MPFNDRVNYMTVLGQMYGALYGLNVEPDFVTAETPDWSQYKMLLVPPLYAAPDGLLERVSRFVEQGGQAVVALKSGFANEHSTVRWVRAPGPLRKAAGVSYQEFSSLPGPVALKPDVFGLKSENTASVWAEMLMPEGAETVLSYEHPFFGKYPAVTWNRFGKGTLVYEGTYPSAALQRALIGEALERAGLTGPDQKLPAAVKVRHGVAAGRALHYYLNVSPAANAVSYSYADGVDLLTNQTVARGGQLELAPWGVAIVGEGK
jgi:beta-galactosidase